MNTDRLRVAVVGAGGWGRQHTRVFSQRPDVELCAVVGRTEERTAARANEFGSRYYLDIQKMLASEKPDLVSVCLPNLEHFQPTLELIRVGVPLLVEKPLVFHIDEADTLIEEAEKRQLFFAINFNHRYARPVQLAKEAITNGKLGELVFASWRFGGEGSCEHHPHGNLIETQCHGFDMLEHLCGPIVSVMAEMTDKTGNGYTTMVLSLGFADGAVGSFVGSYDSSYAYPGTHLLEINGTKGHVDVVDTVRKYSFQAKGNEQREVWEAGYFNDEDREFKKTFDKHLDQIVEAFRAGKNPPVHASSGRRALILAYAAIESFESGKRLAIPAD